MLDPFRIRKTRGPLPIWPLRLLRPETRRNGCNGIRDTNRSKSPEMCGIPMGRGRTMCGENVETAGWECSHFLNGHGGPQDVAPGQNLLGQTTNIFWFRPSGKNHRTEQVITFLGPRTKPSNTSQCYAEHFQGNTDDVDAHPTCTRPIHTETIAEAMKKAGGMLKYKEMFHRHEVDELSLYTGSISQRPPYPFF